MKQMTEAELWRDIASRLETDETCYLGDWGHTSLREIIQCAHRAGQIHDTIYNRAQLRFPTFNGPDEFWWRPEDRDSRILACGLLAAMAEEEEEEGPHETDDDRS